MRLRTAQGKLKVEHSIIDGLRPVLEAMLRSNPEIKSVIPGVIRPVRDVRGKIRLRVTTPTQTGWKVLGFRPAPVRKSSSTQLSPKSSSSRQKGMHPRLLALCLTLNPYLARRRKSRLLRRRH